MPRRSRPHAIHATVVLDAPLATSHGILPAGSRGVVHDTTPDGSFYLVEFTRPFFCAVEVDGAVLRGGASERRAKPPST